MSVNMEDINGFMAGVHGHDFSKGLLPVLHTPGGVTESAQTIVDYLRSKFAAIDVLVPTQPPHHRLRPLCGWLHLSTFELPGEAL